MIVIMPPTFAIPEVKALVRQPQRERAQQLLERLATAVLPILTQRRFRVRRLLEFFPKNDSLLGMNVNRGAKIYIRLRPQSNTNVFLPYEALLETLLHELTHMVHGPHNQAFYKYLDALKSEMETLIVRGLTGEEGVKFGSAGEGQRLGGQGAGVPIRFAAVLAAQRREQYHRLLGGESSRRLGSSSTTRPTDEVLDPQTLWRKVLEAAERRRRDNENCRNVEREGSSHEILGLEGSDEDENATIAPVEANQRHVSRSAIILDDTDELDALQQTASGNDNPTIIDLLDDGEEENADRLTSTASNGAPAGLNERGRKRPRHNVSEIIDLT